MNKKYKKAKRSPGFVLFLLILSLLFGGFGYLCGNGTIDISAYLPTTPINTLPQLPVEGALTVHFIDVGQADSILLSCGGDYMLIDGGNRADGDLVVAYLQDLGITNLDYVVGTHPHEDHMGGLDEVLKEFTVETLWTPELSASALKKVFIQDVLDAAEAQDLTPTQPELGTVYPLGEAQIIMLGPVTYDYDEENDLSLVFLVQFGATRFLFTGDMEKSAESDMLDYWGDGYDFRADVLKVGHHGSTTSTGYRFLRQVDPTAAVISVGTGNSYGHPNQETIDILGDAEVMTYRTDYLGNIIATTDGTDITFEWTNSGKSPYIPD